MFFFFQAEDGIRDLTVTGVQTCALPICGYRSSGGRSGRYYIGGSAGASLTTPSSPVSGSPAGGGPGGSAARAAGGERGGVAVPKSSAPPWGFFPADWPGGEEVYMRLFKN